MNKLFSIDMTSTEASIAYFKATDGMPKEERKPIMEEYFRVSDIIAVRESELAQQGILICG